MPLEVRLTTVFAAGIGMLLLGWRLRRRRMGYAVTLQGGGIGIMYLTIFAAARIFNLVPMPLTLVVMIGLVVFSGFLAVLQDAAAMGVLGAAGGFLAPVLLSTGTGSHVMLFSYFALLNAGVFGIAWFKSWRWLNLLGFGFTFGIGSAWGVQYYRPPFLATTEPFLILFFAFYLTISVLFALRQPPRLKGYVDGTLVFGLPLVVFGLQAGLIKTVPYGLAFSALAMGLVYIGLATLLWRRDTALRALVEAFLALGVIFGSLAVPLALSGSWTAVTWSLEGAALVWIGLRQHRRPALWFGLLLQIASGVLFLLGSDGQWRAMAVINNHFMGGMMVGMAGLFSAYLLERYSARLHQLEQRFGVAMLVWGLLWWFGTGLNEIDRLLSRRHEWPAALTFIGVSALFMGLFYRRLNWQAMRWPAMGLVPVMILAGAAIFDGSIVRHPLQGAWAAVWPAVFFVHAILMRWMDAAWPEKAAVAWHAAGGILAIGLLSWEAGWLLDRLAGGASVWSFVAWGSVPAIGAQGVVRLGKRIAWPSDGWRRAYLGWLPLLLMLWMMVWTTLSLTMDGNPRPLPYLPLMNPLDLSQVAVLLVAFGWLVRVRQEPVAPVMDLPPSLLWSPPLVGVFLWLTAAVARTVHHFADVPYDWILMLQSSLFHAAVSILWGVLALSCMVTSSRWQHRQVWFAGAGLLGGVVVKLFLVDLSGSGTISRIVSFLFVGALMLVIGFFSPIPPAEPKGSDA